MKNLDEKIITLTHSTEGGSVENVKVIYKKSARSKRISIRPYVAENKIVLSYPSGFFIRTKAENFLQSKIDWLFQVFSNPKNQAQKMDFKNGDTFLFLGQKVKINHNVNHRGTVIENGVLNIGGQEQFIARRVKEFCKKEFLNFAKQRTKFYVEKLPKPHIALFKVVIKDVSSRWGSCSSSGNITYAFKLAFKTLDEINYVIAHEVAHLKEMNHSGDFWNIVGLIFEGNYKLQRRKLKTL